MTRCVRRSLCPIDFSESSRGALRYAGAIAAHFGARLTILAVNDPLLGEAVELTAGAADLVEDTVREIEKFFRQTFAHTPHGVADVRSEVATGKPALEILRVSRERGDLIVMSSDGLTGFRKLFFGSTIERVLREALATFKNGVLEIEMPIIPVPEAKKRTVEITG